MNKKHKFKEEMNHHHHDSHLRERYYSAALGRRLSGNGGACGLCLPSITAHLTCRWAD